MKKIVFTGGGTFGHAMPNVYLIDELKNCECYYIGSKGIEKDLLKGKVKKYYQIDAVKLVRGKFFVNLKIPFALIRAIHKAKQYLKEIKPDVIFSKGGYVALPVCLAGRKLHIPIVAHESDFSFGLANKIILKLCNKMCVNFKSLAVSNKIVYTGPIFSPNFDNFTTNLAGLRLDSDKPTMLVVCGSLGSQKINQCLYPVLKSLMQKYNIIHITGKGNKNWASFDNYNQIEICNNMVNLYNIADFVLGRSGAGVTAECFYKHIPMLLVPLENKSSRGDQLQNARYYKNMGVGEIVREQNLTPTILENTIDDFYATIQQKRDEYKKIDTPNGLKKTLEVINSFIGK